MYRGKDIGDRKQFVHNCLRMMQEGRADELFEILPHLSLVQDDSFLPTLLRMLRSADRTRIMFAAMALGNLRDPAGIQPLREIFLIPETTRGAGSRALQEAIITSLGEIGHPDGVAVLLEIHGMAPVDEFAIRRQELIVWSLGTLAQHDIREAEEQLYRFLQSEEPPVRVLALEELGVSYWHRPRALTDERGQQLASFLRDPSQAVQEAAASTLLSLAELGSEVALAALGHSDDSD